MKQLLKQQIYWKEELSIVSVVGVCTIPVFPMGKDTGRVSVSFTDTLHHRKLQPGDHLQLVQIFLSVFAV